MLPGSIYRRFRRQSKLTSHLASGSSRSGYHSIELRYESTIKSSQQPRAARPRAAQRPPEFNNAITCRTPSKCYMSTCRLLRSISVGCWLSLTNVSPGITFRAVSWASTRACCAGVTIGNTSSREEPGKGVDLVARAFTQAGVLFSLAVREHERRSRGKRHR